MHKRGLAIRTPRQLYRNTSVLTFAASIFAMVLWRYLPSVFMAGWPKENVLLVFYALNAEIGIVMWLIRSLAAIIRMDARNEQASLASSEPTSESTAEVDII